MTETPENLAPEAQRAEGQAPDNGQGANWFAGFEGEELGYIQNKGWDKEDGVKKLVDSYKNLEKLRGVPEDKLIRIPDGEEGWDAVYKKLGKPDDVTGYKYEPAEGEIIDESRLNWFSKTAHELNLSKTQHTALVKAASEYEGGILNARQEAETQERELKLKDLKDEWGQAYEERLQLGKRAVRAFGADEAQIDQLEEAIGSNADVLKLFANIGMKIGEDKVILENDSERSFGETPEQSMAKFTAFKEELKADKERLADFNTNPKSLDRAKFERLQRLANG